MQNLENTSNQRDEQVALLQELSRQAALLQELSKQIDSVKNKISMCDAAIGDLWTQYEESKK